MLSSCWAERWREPPWLSWVHSYPDKSECPTPPVILKWTTQLTFCFPLGNKVITYSCLCNFNWLIFMYFFPGFQPWAIWKWHWCIMAARTSPRICCLSWSSGHKHRCTGRSLGCLWQHESDGDDYASLWQPGKGEYPGGEHGAGLSLLLWHLSQEFCTLLASDTPGTRHLSGDMRWTRCLTVMSVRAVRHLCWNCKAVPAQENGFTCQGQWALTEEPWLRKQEVSGSFPQAVAFPSMGCQLLEPAFSFPSPNCPLPVHLPNLSQFSSCPYFSWISPASSSQSTWHQAASRGLPTEHLSLRSS